MITQYDKDVLIKMVSIEDDSQLQGLTDSILKKGNLEAAHNVVNMA